MLNKVIKIIKLIEKQVRPFTIPFVTRIAFKKDPYRILISCILSLRTKDKTTVEASNRIFSVAHNPSQMMRLTKEQIQKLIYPVGFYRTKSKVISGISRRLLDDFKGKVPDSLDELLSFKGVGRKTANLVLGLGFGIPAICVDTHVHRISNRLGWVKTKDPGETEKALQKIIPKKYWIDLNTSLVAFGQNRCLPVSPYCSVCSVRIYCKRIGVGKSR